MMIESAIEIAAIGEALLRFAPPPGERLETSPAYAVYVGGAELNVMTALAGLGIAAAFFTRLPDHPAGRRIVSAARAAGCRTQVAWTGEGRVGTYYYQPGQGGLPAQVTYDRAGSAFCALAPEDIDWEALLSARWLHLTGITPALSPGALAVVRMAVERARAAGTRISFDVNYRSTLWGAAAARETLLPLIAGVDVLFCGRGDARAVFGIDGQPERIVRALADLTGARCIVTSLGDAGVIGLDTSGVHMADAPAVPIVDRVGAGDALAAGVLYGLLRADLAAALQYGTALAAIKLAQYGDAVCVTARELDRAVETGQASAGRVIR
ncbi:MAG: sugar kinase [Candidatus Flexifilum sp.]|jgi:2-dehydro-3-deoxygluconokinase